MSLMHAHGRGAQCSPDEAEPAAKRRSNPMVRSAAGGIRTYLARSVTRWFHSKNGAVPLLTRGATTSRVVAPRVSKVNKSSGQRPSSRQSQVPPPVSLPGLNQV